MSLVLGMKHSDRIRMTLEDGTEIWLKMVFGSWGIPRLVIDAPDSVRIEREKIIPRHAADCPAATRHPDDKLFGADTFACTCGAVRKD